MGGVEWVCVTLVYGQKGGCETCLTHVHVKHPREQKDGRAGEPRPHPRKHLALSAVRCPRGALAFGVAIARISTSRAAEGLGELSKAVVAEGLAGFDLWYRNRLRHIKNHLAARERTRGHNPASAVVAVC